MKTLYLSLFLLVYSQISHAQIKTLIKETYYQNWIGGLEESGTGTDFYILFKKPLPKHIQLKELYFNNQSTSFSTVSNTIYLFSYVYKKQNIEIQPSKKITPLKIKPNQALLVYLLKGKINYFIINKIKQKETLAYPSAKPNEDKDKF